MRRALVSVYDKSGVVDFSRGLAELGFEIISTGGTARALRDAGCPVLEVSGVTGFPEILGGRVKTLHPRVHGAILGLREDPVQAREMEAHSLVPIDLVCVNLYPFREVLLKGGSHQEIVENIDIGGPSMLRSAAKNYRHVAVLVNPARYGQVLGMLGEGDIPLDYRHELAWEAFKHTAAYDALIASYFSQGAMEFPDRLAPYYEKVMDLRYGENPHQKAALYGLGIRSGPSVIDARQLQGKDLSYNNIADADAALGLAREFDAPVAVAVKHQNPCGVGLGSSPLEAYRKAHDADPVSIFGGIVALNREVDEGTAREMSKVFLEVVLAPSFSDEAARVFSTKKDVRLLETGDMGRPSPGLELRSVAGGLLVQESDLLGDAGEWRVVTGRAPTEDEMENLRFAWAVSKHVKSNAMVAAGGLGTVGIGAGQMSRIEATRIALRQAGERARGAVMASDAFLPFPDVVEEAARSGIRALVQPGGSVKDPESIKAASRAGMAMVFTGRRHFRH
jgi:phosphoribosylaminoimidazolecarboxamide formyltransferase/IMP cyclohydrolase